MNGIGALAYLEWRRFIHVAAQIVRSPLRLIPWIFVFLFLGLSLFIRVVLGYHQRPVWLSMHVASIASGIILLMLAGSAYAGSSGRISGFANVAEAYFLNRARIDERLTLWWLSLRRPFANLGFYGPGLLCFAMVYGRSRAFEIAAGAIGLLAVGSALPIFCYGLSRCYGVWVARLPAALAAIAALYSLAAGAADIDTISGRTAILVWTGHPWVIATFYLAWLAAATLGTLLLDDVYPELFAGIRILGLVPVVKNGESARRAPHREIASTTTSLRGPLALLWKEWIGVRRTFGRLLTVLVFAVLVAGIAAGEAIRHHWQYGIYAAGGLLFTFLLMNLSTGITLARDLVNPIWWMGHGSAFQKLAIWTVARAATGGGLIGFGVLVAGLVAGSVVFGVVGALVAILLCLSIQAIGLLIYGFLPSALDQRGPALFAKTLLLYVWFIPPIATGFVAFILVQQPLLAVLAASITLTIEGAIAISIAAWRIEGRGAEVASAESA
ncbi:MAG TPA: hypothetical protein VMG98_10990 [Verrucomicrobiae bacterium]|nr:hypothetical protein [Verrucomicrobiae bacterium]